VFRLSFNHLVDGAVVEVHATAPMNSYW